jgi:Ca2+-binding EF-hand superfamily protein
MDMKVWFVVLLLASLQASAATPSSQPAGTPPPPPSAVIDLCHGPIDPYLPGAERTRFLNAVGVDNELSEEEFRADLKRDTGFARSYDRWKALTAFDKNHNDTVDWFEADAYRRDLRAKVIARFDRNGDGRLTGEERVSASRALAAGRLTEKPRGAGPRTPFERRMLQEFDADGDGVLNEAEKDAALEDMRRRQRERMLDRFDTDGDGELSQEERAAMREGGRGRFGQRIEDWKLRDFDSDGDGELSEEENEALKGFQERLGQLGKHLDLRFNDLDGDGEVTREERLEVGKQWRGQRWKIMVRFAGLMDSDGDGQVSPREMEGFNERAQGAMLTWMEDFSLRFDDDQDGRLLTPRERDAMVGGLQEELDVRLTRHDKDGSGHLQPNEVLDFAEEFLTQIGLGRRSKSPSPGDDQSK